MGGGIAQAKQGSKRHLILVKTVDGRPDLISPMIHVVSMYPPSFLANMADPQVTGIYQDNWCCTVVRWFSI